MKRHELIKKAASLPKGSPERLSLLHKLKKGSEAAEFKRPGFYLMVSPVSFEDDLWESVEEGTIQIHFGESPSDAIRNHTITLSPEGYKNFAQGLIQVLQKNL